MRKISLFAALTAAILGKFLRHGTQRAWLSARDPARNRCRDQSAAPASCTTHPQGSTGRA